jgi:hypothetical protein
MKIPEKIQSNKQFINYVIDNSQYGVVTQAFIIEALMAYCKSVIEAKDEFALFGMISDQLWRDVAIDVKEAIDDRYSHKPRSTENN